MIFSPPYGHLDVGVMVFPLTILFLLYFFLFHSELLQSGPQLPVLRGTCEENCFRFRFVPIIGISSWITAVTQPSIYRSLTAYAHRTASDISGYDWSPFLFPHLIFPFASFDIQNAIYPRPEVVLKALSKLFINGVINEGIGSAVGVDTNLTKCQDITGVFCFSYE